MDKNLPDKWVRKAVYDAVNAMTISGKTIKVYDTRATGSAVENQYIIMSSQSNEVDNGNKCEKLWDAMILLEVYTKYDSQGNTGSRVLTDDILDELKNKVLTISLDVLSNLTILTKVLSFPSDITTVTDNEIVFRKFLRLEMKIA